MSLKQARLHWIFAEINVFSLASDTAQFHVPVLTALFVRTRCAGLGYVGPCRYGTGRPRVVDGGDGLHMWRVTANVLNKPLRPVEKGWSSTLKVGQGLITHRRKNQIFMEY
jgi:hypothetical protein